MSQRERRALVRHLTDFPKTIAFEHNDRVLGRRVAQTELEKMLPELANGGRREFLERNRPRRLLTAFILASVKNRIDLVIRDWRAFVVNGS